MDLKKLAQSLHPYERRVLPELVHAKYVSEVVARTGLKDVEVTRALQWLENKKAIEVRTDERELVSLDKNGVEYLKKGLPERRFLEALDEKELALTKVAQKSQLSNEEMNICIGLLRQKGAILILKDKELKVKRTDQGKKLVQGQFLEERFVKREFPCELAKLSSEEKAVVEQLKKRKQIIKIEREKVKRAELTDIGKKLVDFGVRDENIVDAVTPQILQQGSWKKKSFRRYDVTSNVPLVFGGRRQPYRAFLDWVKYKFVSLGFTEMSGPLVESEFWNMDALFMPQFHSARDIQDVYFVKEPKFGKLDESFVKRVKAVHETGSSTGSLGWGYHFDVERTHRQVLRSQGTACSARMMASPDFKIPGKYFGISRVFRPDVIDATHGADFNQVEGLVVEEDLNFRHLVGLLRMFAKEFAGADEIRLAPAYFPFTEPSVELHAKHPQLGWIELGGAGIFRPEVVTPLLGRHVNVCAWGLGIDRLGMFKLGFKDIRSLFSQDVAFLRTTKVQ